MGHPLRWFIPNVVYEITITTHQERYLLRPSAQSRDLINGVLGRAQQLYDVRIHGYNYLSNHGHDLVSAEDGEQLALFLGHVNGNIARKVGPLHGWKGTFWGRRSRELPIIDELSQIERLRYVMAQGTKEGLVASPHDWPGASSLPGLLGDMTVRGRWVDRDGLRAARRSRPETPERDFTSYPTVRLSPMPCWEHLDRDALREKHLEIVAEIEHDAAVSRRGRRVLGVAAVLKTNPQDRPKKPAHGPAPLCHTVSSVLRDRFRAAYRAFVAAFREAAEMMKDLVRVASDEVPRARVEHLVPRFPGGSYPRPRWFVATRMAIAEVTLDMRQTGPPLNPFAP
jgi:hypothetical protein